MALSNQNAETAADIAALSEGFAPCCSVPLEPRESDWADIYGWCPRCGAWWSYVRPGRDGVPEQLTSGPWTGDRRRR